MKITKRLTAIGLLAVVVLACHKDHSLEDGKHHKLPDDYPFATGYCAGVRLDGAVYDTLIYAPDTTTALPSSVMLDMPPAGDQSSQGSCAAWASTYAVGSYYAHITTGKPYSDTGNLSAKYTYNQIAKGNCTCTSFQDNLYLLKTQGAATLKAMPYDASECLKQPDSAQRNAAANNRIFAWGTVDAHQRGFIKRALAAKIPVMFVIAVDEAFQFIDSPYIWKARRTPPGGLHGLVITGYDDDKHVFRIMNSWSTLWGDNGFAWIDYDFFRANVIGPAFVVLN